MKSFISRFNYSAAFFLAAIMAVFFVTVQSAFAQATGAPASPYSTSSEELWTMVIGLITPLIVQGIKALVPKIPKALLPLSTPFVGILVGLTINKLIDLNLGWIDMGKAGGLAVFVRESWNQVVTKNLSDAKLPSIEKDAEKE